jgi:hypothetical protein
MSVLDVLKHTQQLFNSRDRQGRGTDVVGIKCQVGGLNRNEAFDMGLQPDYTTPTELRMMRDVDKREGPSIHRVTGIVDGDGLVG